MSVHIEVEVIESANAKRKKIELAIVRALNRTALWLKSKAAKKISEEKKSLIRKRLRIFKAKTSRLEVLIRANLYDIRASTIGKIQKTRRGSKVGKHEFIGGFAAVMPKGNSGMFKREGRAALPIKEVKLPLEPEASRIIENFVNYEVEKVFEKFFHRELSYITPI
ncbi:putative minor tail protein z [Wolbachia endosymbiont of Culex quinquefasciatus JHB]|uniref:phage tail protein n=1 Tax=Wolbachia endosymbiont of Culex quinquefasciatus TaxID=263437 RepID=UPI0001761CC3|nr:phage tail protein [Wolbachia endosymbiont of Culex quinquefasciatus]EEB55299.1 putative minor tail protein z [Wolbachia endosymbiont of Culex quinquefasciatus JHB]EEB56099.1 putative minor tail protein z [Wolbachia endosymbiont of Culex quinquefasciatus JHB]CAQ54356.1 Puative minor tail protein z [Wolbachia endosymbiont of Culex quinquefasciatus Pel]CAQ54438.1 Putative minor tail protein z [Wolbachia endosymbiont of Culex quinquefasciatus Pel]